MTSRRAAWTRSVPRGRWLLFTSLAVIAACSQGTSPQQRDEVVWRDQFIFIGDDGVVVPLALVRSSRGHAEAKGWLGIDGAWQQRFYHQYSIDPADAPSIARSAEALSKAAGTPVRVRYTELGDSIRLELRLRAGEAVLEASSVPPMGRARDPEGSSIYRAGRAMLSLGPRGHRGWLVIENTPATEPRPRHVDYGDFLFAVVAEEDRAVVLKQSSSAAGFTHGFATTSRGHVTEVEQPRASLSENGLSLSLSAADASVMAAAALDRQVTTGEDPARNPIQYQVVLLGGPPGVAFAIRPQP